MLERDEEVEFTDKSESPRGRWDGILSVRKDPRGTIGDRGCLPRWVLDTVGSLRVGYDCTERRVRLWRCCGYDVRLGFQMETVPDGHPQDSAPRRTDMTERALESNYREAHITDACWRMLDRAEQLNRVPTADELPGVLIDLTVERARLLGFLSWSAPGTVTERGRRALQWWYKNRDVTYWEVPRCVF